MRIVEAERQHLVYQWICGGVGVNYQALADFRVRHGEALDELLTQSVASLMNEGLMELKRLAQDGMKVRVSAGASSFRRRKTLRECLKQAKKQVRELRRELVEQAFHPTARRLQAFSKIGLVPDAGGTWFLVKRLGLARALGCAILGEKLSGRDAREQGLIRDLAAEGEDCVEAALKLAQRLAGLPTKTLVGTRRLLRAAASNELEAQLDAECAAQTALGKTHDSIEGVTAFLEKRPPRFRGEWADRTRP